LLIYPLDEIQTYLLGKNTIFSSIMNNLGTFFHGRSKLRIGKIFLILFGLGFRQIMVQIIDFNFYK
jgi:hypothetical protein